MLENSIWKHPLVIIFSIFFGLYLFGKIGPTIPISVLSQQKGEPFVVTGEGKVFVTPDIAKLSFGIQESGSSLKTVQESVSKKSNTLTASFKDLGIREEDIKTTSYSVYPEYDYQAPEQRITGFQVSISYEVTIRDFDKVNDAITSATEAGANVASGVSFEVNESTKKEKLLEARKLAVDEAKETAEGLAKASGLNLGKVINISENQMGGVPPPIFQRELTLDSAGTEPAPKPDVAPGETEIQVTVVLSYEIR